MVWDLLFIAAAALKTPTRNGYFAQGVNLTFIGASLLPCPPEYARRGNQDRFIVKTKSGVGVL